MKSLLVKSMLVYIFSTTVMIFSFQNCARVKFGQKELASTVASTDWCTNYPNSAECVQKDFSKCSFNGMSYNEGQIVVGFLSSGGTKCEGQNRICKDGAFTGSYAYASCISNAPLSCLFNGRTILSGGSATGFKNSAVVFGQSCASENRVCTNGVLSGSFPFGSCTAGIAQGCLFNGRTIDHGSSVKGYVSSSVPAGQACQSSTRLCLNGILGSNGNFASCTVGGAQACLFNGQTIPDGAAATGFQTSTVASGSSCASESRRCAGGVLSGNFGFASCTVGGAVSCTFNGQTVISGQTVKGFQNSSVASGQQCVSQDRLCTNGNLAGTYTFNSCAVGAAASCTFNGQTIVSGQTVKGYQISSVPFGQQCAGQDRLCTNGNLAGSFNFASCLVGGAQACLLNGETIPSGQRVTAFQSASPAFGQSCVSESRLCTNGNLAGSFFAGNCTVGGPASCIFNGGSVPSGTSVKAYLASSAPFGQGCSSQDRLCLNGILSGTNTFGTCTVGGAQSCLLDGRTIAHGEPVLAFSSRSVLFGSTCVSESRSCNNGTLSGNAAFQYLACSEGTAGPCSFNGVAIGNGNSVQAFATASVSYGQNCAQQNRLCNNGNLSGTYSFSSCAVGSAPAGSCSVTPNKTSLMTADTLSVSIASQNASRVQTACNTNPWSDIANGQSWGPNTFAPGISTCNFRGINQYTLQPFDCNPSQVIFTVTAPVEAKKCLLKFEGIDSSSNQAGQINRCLFSLPEAVANSGPQFLNSISQGGTLNYYCDANGNFQVTGSSCPTPAEPAPVQKLALNGQHCDIGGSWGWRGWDIQCPSGTNPVNPSSVGGCPAGWSQYGGTGCYISNRDPNRLMNGCSGADPSDECCTYMCSASAPAPQWTCNRDMTGNQESGQYYLDTCSCTDNFQRSGQSTYIVTQPARCDKMDFEGSCVAPVAEQGHCGKP